MVIKTMEIIQIMSGNRDNRATNQPKKNSFQNTSYKVSTPTQLMLNYIKIKQQLILYSQFH